MWELFKMKKIILFYLLLLSSLVADFEQGEKIFKDKCSSCHTGFVDMDTLKENFYVKQNTLLNLKAPTENMLVYAIMRGPKSIGDKDDEEMRQIEIEEYLKNHLEDPNTLHTICEPEFFKYYATKSCDKIILDEEEAILLSAYFMEYKEPEKEKRALNPLPEKLTKKALEKAKQENKNIIVYASSKTCYFCKKMDREVLDLADIKQSIKRDFVFLKVYVEEHELPFGLRKEYSEMTPTFFFINHKQERLNIYPGAWIKEDFIKILKENEPKK